MAAICLGLNVLTIDCSLWYNSQLVVIDVGNGLASKRRQAIIMTNDDPTSEICDQAWVFYFFRLRGATFRGTRYSHDGLNSIQYRVKHRENFPLFTLISVNIIDPGDI